MPGRVSLEVIGALRRRKRLWRFLRNFSAAAEAAGGSPYLVGGIVRDLIEGCPGRDVDLMVAGIGYFPLGRIVRSLPREELGIRRVVSAGKRFAVYKVFTSWSAEEIDVALARSEFSTGPGHRQFEVRTDGVDARTDAARRDFTINSLMVRLLWKGGRLTGEVLDFFGGMDDLRCRRIRGVGNPRDRIREDPLRMLRAIRQKNERTGYRIEKGTWRAIRGEAGDLIGTIPRERLVGELTKSLAANPSGTIADLYRGGILPALIPGIRNWGAGPLSRLKKRYDLLERRVGRPLPETLLFANLLLAFAEDEIRGRARGGDSGRRGRIPREGGSGEGRFLLPGTNALARGLHVPRVRKVVRMLEDLACLTHLRRLSTPRARVEEIFGRWKSPDHLHALYAAARTAAGGKPEDFRPILAKAAGLPLLLHGDDVLALGVPAGPLVDAILDRVREETLAGTIHGRKEAMRLAAGIWQKERSATAASRHRTERFSRRRTSKRPAKARTRTKSSGIR
ncbi:MAG TPA: hypothetical protein VE080_01565 [Candidatus Aquicultoraceae bacterium]|nr:hypothetical protein [Candidatus Aquicultoraceae bacterium]